MTAIIRTATSAQLRRLVPATIFAAALALGGSAFGAPPMARAEWDIEAYDACMKNMNPSSNPAAWDAYCCVWSGGDYHSGKCWAPVNVQGPATPPPPRPLPPGAVNPGPPVVANQP